MRSRNNDGKIVIVLIIMLISFGLGSGIGITVGMSGDDLNTTLIQKPINTTIDVTHNISQDNPNYNMSINAYQDNYDDLNSSNSSKNINSSIISNNSKSSNSSNSSTSVIYYSKEDLANKSYTKSSKTYTKSNKTSD